MITKFLFDRISTPDLELSLDAYSARQKAITNNIANANTPGYKAQKVSFEDEYRKHLDETELRGDLTHKKHFEIGYRDLQKISPRNELRESRQNDTGINNVDIDFEMAELAKNSLRYEMSTTLISKRFQAISTSIKGR
ncbi:MAG: flagellar basal body rod protein FlgB [Candidatus Cloacimonetes bacterium]|nr:flagellar basal body rod protein FlgB [Candidatus Cloacimonadota bacterium]